MVVLVGAFFVVAVYHGLLKFGGQIVADSSVSASAGVKRAYRIAGCNR
jgi:hypothetical protein